MSGENAEKLSTVQRLERKLEKHQAGVDKAMDTHDVLGTPEGPARYNPAKVPQSVRPAIEQETRRVKLEIANRTLKILVDQELMLQNYLGIAKDAETEYKAAQDEYLASSGSAEDDEKFTKAHEKMEAVRQEIDTLFAPRPKKKAEKNQGLQEQEEVITVAEKSGDGPDETAEEHEDNEEEVEEMSTALVETGNRKVIVRPARLHIPRGFVLHLEWARKATDDPLPIKQQEQGLAMTVSQIRTGALHLPSVMDYMQTNDEKDISALETQVHTTIQGLIAEKILLPNGNINDRPGLSQMLAKDLNDLIGMAGIDTVATTVRNLPTVEKELLCSCLSVAMREKLGNPDLQTCDPEDLAAYFENSLYDILAPERKEHRKSEWKDYFGESEPLVWKDNYHIRSTELPVEAEEIFDEIMERDMRDGNNTAQRVIESLLHPEKTSNIRFF